MANPENTVNSEIFVRILFWQIALKDIYVEFKNLREDLIYRVFRHFARVYFHETFHMLSFVKIKLSQGSAVAQW